MLRLHNYDCKAIRSLEELSIEDQMKNFNFIVSDILFDGIAPLDFVYQIKEIILHKSLIIVTKMGQNKVQQQVMDSNAVAGFFAVPLDLDEIEKILDT